jgi:hypothetical protein
MQGVLCWGFSNVPQQIGDCINLYLGFNLTVLSKLTIGDGCVKFGKEKIDVNMSQKNTENGAILCHVGHI